MHMKEVVVGVVCGKETSSYSSLFSLLTFSTLFPLYVCIQSVIFLFFLLFLVSFISNIKLIGLDTRETKLHLEYCEEPYIGKKTDRMLATIVFDKKFTVKKQKQIIVKFNELLNEYRNKYVQNDNNCQMVQCHPNAEVSDTRNDAQSSKARKTKNSPHTLILTPVSLNLHKIYPIPCILN